MKNSQMLNELLVAFQDVFIFVQGRNVLNVRNMPNDFIFVGGCNGLLEGLVTGRVWIMQMVTMLRKQSSFGGL